MTDTNATTLYTALLAAQKQMGPVRKDSNNPAFRTKYASLQSVLETIEGPLGDNGLVMVQRLQYDRVGRDGGAGEGTPILITELIHAASGEKLDSVVAVSCKDPLDPQKVGGALTYYRRYSLLALLGLAPEDDDGNTASQPARNAPAPQRAAQPQPTPLQRPQAVQPAADPDINYGWTELWAFAKARGMNDRNAIAARIGRPIAGLTPSEVQRAIVAAEKA